MKFISKFIDSRTFTIILIGSAIGAVSMRLIAASAKSSSAKAAAPAAARVPDRDRGEYLVREVAGCGDCHSQRDARGEFVPSLWLMGGPLTFKPAIDMPVWAEVALPIAGLPTIPTDEEAIAFLMTGKRADGRTARPPMPSYHLDASDAADVVAYLRSLSGQTASR